MIRYKINLQHFAGEEKTEKATPKKRREAREKGQVFQSKEINSVIILIASLLGLRIFGGHIYGTILDYTKKVLSDHIINDSFFTIKGMQILFMEIITITLTIVAPITLVIVVVGLVINYAQVGFLFTTKALEFKLSRLNPIDGFKKLFSKRSLVELFKSLLKTFIVIYVVYFFGYREISNIINLFNMNLESIFKYIGEITYKTGIRICLVLIPLAVFDYLYQWWDYEKNLRMSKQEIKEEYKQTEGDPKVKSKIKEKQRQMAMRRMMQDVPKADVIITNPTHFAVAIKYDKYKFDAPYVVAKGKDLVAQKIKEIAKTSSIPIVENKLLAQTLYKTVDIGQVIPEELYQAVAEVLAYVYSLRQSW